MSTERMNDNQGTDRMDAGTARMDGNKGGAAGPQKAGIVFSSGQTVVLNGRNCVIDSTISGSTGEAVVYKVTIDGKPYALKHYKPNMSLSDTAKKVIAKIKDNPRDRIIKIYDFGSYNEQDFEIMEYAEGGTLEQYLKNNGALHDTTKIKNIVKMITEGLEQLHGGYKVIYQDLKPENIYFRDAAKTSLVLADFGISSIMEGYDEEVEVTASITDLYAAPELAHKGNRNEVMVTPSVDYFALGITMFELWLGEKPFKGVKATKRDYLIAEEKVDFPIDMPDDYAAIIRGLIRPQRKDRWGNEQVRKWLKGEALAIESGASQKASAVYEPLKFSNTESAASPKELAALMEKYPDIGKTCLYDGIIKDRLQKAGDMMLYNAIQNITSQYAQDKDAGLYTAILALDPERPFKSRGGKICKTTEDIADAIMVESAYYMEDLKKPTANLYLYLAATEGSQGKEAADTFCKYFKEYSPKRALTLVYLKLQSDGGITIGSKHYQSPDELKYEKDGAQIDLIKKAVKEKDSMLLVWLSDIFGDNLKSTDGFNYHNILEFFFLLGLLPFLSFEEFFSNSGGALQYLIDSCPGRSDLFEIYAAQGLSLAGHFYLDSKTPIDYVVCNFINLITKHGTDTIRNLIRLLCKLGADVNEHSGDGTCPLINAYNANDNALVKLLLDLGADESQYRVYKERIDEQARIERERREEQERQEKKEAEARRREEEKAVKREANKKKRRIIGLLAAGITVAALITFIYFKQTYRQAGSFFRFKQNDQGTITITRYRGKEQVVIPATINDINVTKIGDKAFFGKKITDITIPDGVTSIGNSAFEEVSGLTIVTIPNSVTNIGDGAFTNCKSLTSVTISNSITNIEANIFAGCNSLTSVTIPDSVTSIEVEAFSFCNSLTSVTIPNSVTSIGYRAFSFCDSLTSVTIGNSVNSIGNTAFLACNSLTNITIPNSVTIIEKAAFRRCGKLTSVTFESKSVELEVSHISDGSLEYPFPGDLRDKYLTGGKGTYTRPSGSNTWTKKR